VKTLADLRAVKEKAKQELAAREENAKFRIVVAMGTCGIAAGARNVMSAILDEMNKQDIKNTVITQTGCLGYCDQEPLVQIFEAGKPVVTYGKVNETAARRIIQEHIRNDRIVGDLVFISH
jgi:NADP-reducing hydrogenase subunit HndB